jgi:hypothetical protein
MLTLPRLCLLLCLAIAPVLSAQGARVLFPEIAPISGSFEGSERWIVHFAERPFDLSAFREAIWTGRPAAEVHELVRGLDERARAHQAEFAREIQSLGGRMVQQWWLINACAVDLPKGAIQTVRGIKNIALVEPDRVWEPLIKTATNASNHNADLLQSRGIKGLGVTTAILDSGLDEDMNGSGRPHRTFYVDGDPSKLTGSGIGKSRLVINRQIGTQPADDVHGHGTGVASIVAGGDWGTSTADHGHAYGADIAGYAIANTTKGSSTTAVIATAWQSVAADKATFNIVTANNSYSGSPDPLNAAQKALDACALNADVLPVTAAGNNSGVTTSSQINVNGISVGAVSENDHKRASFTSYGTADGQLFPDISANGVGTNMARRNDETRDYTGSGTSMAAPQVCGAATQLRGLIRSLRADQCKAILLATTAQNQYAGSTQVNTGPGCGYLKNDAALDTALNALRNGRGTLDAAQPVVRRTMAVTQGTQYQFAIAWHRLDENSSTWSNLDLRVLDGTSLVLESKTLRNTEEFVRFTAKNTGTLTIEIVATSLSAKSQAFAWASTADTQASSGQPGVFASFGSGCVGSFTVPTPSSFVLPSSEATSFGSSNNLFGVGRADQRYMQVFDATQMPSSSVITGYSLRQDESVPGGSGGAQTYTILLGYTSKGVDTLGNDFAANWDLGKPSQVFQGTVNLPTFTGSNNDPSAFAFSVKFQAPFVYTQSAGQNLLLELQNTSSADISTVVDAVNGSGVRTTRLYAFSATAATGVLAPNSGLVYRFDTVAGSRAVAPQLSSSELPTAGKSFQLDLSQGRKSSGAAMLLGFSKTSWAGIPLPFDLGLLGAKGCDLLVSWDILVPTVTDASGDAAVRLPLPAGKDMLGATFHSQFLVLDPPANPLGFVWSNGGSATIGG